MTADTALRSPVAPASTKDLDERRFLTWAGWSGVVATAAFVATSVATSGSPAPPDAAGEMVTYLEEVASSPWVFYVYGICGIVLCLLYVPMSIGVHRLLGRPTVSWFGTAAVLAGLAVLFPAYVVNLLVPAGLAPVATDLGEAGADTLFTVHTYVEAAAETCFTVGSVLSLGIGPLLWGWAWRRSSTPPRWLGWVAVATGVTGMVWFVWLVPVTGLVLVIMVNVLLSLLLFTALSVVLLRRGGGRR